MKPGDSVLFARLCIACEEKWCNLHTLHPALVISVAANATHESRCDHSGRDYSMVDVLDRKITVLRDGLISDEFMSDWSVI